MDSNLINKKQIISIIKSILTYGIDVGTKTDSEKADFLTQMGKFINEKSRYSAYLDSDKVLTIETIYYDPLIIIEIEDGIMLVIPITDQGFFEAFMVVIEFFSFMADREEIDKIRKQKEIEKKDLPKDDDFEWI
tara:strand:+ start:2221 stop:2622 length:402 start_codon:yes stop_codon:yes gene_type:complete